jgi:hypothetical protein
MFDIRLTAEPVPDSDGAAVYGRIQIEDYTETFVASLVCWSPDQYEQQWRDACQRLLDGASGSALITSYVDPSVSEFLVWWPLYRDGPVVHVRNELVPYSQLARPFSIEDPWSSIRVRQILSDEGMEISEWDTQVESLRDFLKQSVQRR